MPQVALALSQFWQFWFISQTSYLLEAPKVDFLPLFHVQAWLSDKDTKVWITRNCNYYTLTAKLRMVIIIK